jgi:hypothetical protein
MSLKLYTAPCSHIPAPPYDHAPPYETSM